MIGATPFAWPEADTAGTGTATPTINGTPPSTSRAFPPGQPLNLACSFTDLDGNPTDCTVTLSLMDPFGLTTYPKVTRGTQGNVACQLMPPTPSVGLPPRQGASPVGSAPWIARFQASDPFMADTGPVPFTVLPCFA